jgi:hypothetical protein
MSTASEHGSSPIGQEADVYIALLEDIADRLSVARQSRVYDVTPEDAFSDAIWSVQQAIRDAIKARAATSPDYVLVPREPTKEMLAAGALGSGEDSETVAAGAWVEMIKAAITTSTAGR